MSIIEKNKKRPKRKKKSNGLRILFSVFLLAILCYLAFIFGEFISRWSGSDKVIEKPTAASDVLKEAQQPSTEIQEKELEKENNKPEVSEPNKNNDNTDAKASDLLNTVPKDAHNYQLSGYIESFGSDYLDIDEIEFISPNDDKRIKELGLNKSEDFVSGFYIYNKSSGSIPLKIASDCDIELIDFDNPEMRLQKSNISELENVVSKGKVPFHFTVKNDYIVQISQVYIP